MYLHIGGGAVVPREKLLGVFDLDRVSVTQRGREFLEAEERQGRLHTVADRLPVALVVTDTGSWLSPISSQTLGKRLAEDRWDGGV